MSINSQVLPDSEPTAVRLKVSHATPSQTNKAKMWYSDTSEVLFKRENNSSKFLESQVLFYITSSTASQGLGLTLLLLMQMNFHASLFGILTQMALFHKVSFFECFAVFCWSRGCESRCTLWDVTRDGAQFLEELRDPGLRKACAVDRIPESNSGEFFQQLPLFIRSKEQPSLFGESAAWTKNDTSPRWLLGLNPTEPWVVRVAARWTMMWGQAPLSRMLLRVQWAPLRVQIPKGPRMPQRRMPGPGHSPMASVLQPMGHTLLLTCESYRRQEFLQHPLRRREQARK